MEFIISIEDIAIDKWILDYFWLFDSKKINKGKQIRYFRSACIHAIAVNNV